MTFCKTHFHNYDTYNILSNFIWTFFIYIIIFEMERHTSFQRIICVCFCSPIPTVPPSYGCCLSSEPPGQHFHVITSTWWPRRPRISLPLFDHNWYWMAFTPWSERNLFLWLCEQMATEWWRVLLLFKISRREWGLPEAFLPTRRAGREITNILARIWGVCASYNTNLLSNAEEDAVNLRHFAGWKLFFRLKPCQTAN